MNTVFLSGKVVKKEKKEGAKTPLELKIEEVKEWKGERPANFDPRQYHKVAIWGKFAEMMNSKISEGDRVFIEGILESKNVKVRLKNEHGQDLMVGGKPYDTVQNKVEIKVKKIEVTEKLK